MDEEFAFLEVGAAPQAPLAVPTVPAAPKRGPLPARRGRAAKIVPLTREQEYHYIHGDLERLLKIASVLLVAMIALGFIIER
ncbi:MAG: hypothetical protein IT337_01790 [Thermomicrobiales bacterium]|nr:hypothetical protein [Thermomicrobiales bacterium]